MPRYFFDLHDGQHTTDTEGTELASLEAARVEAVWVAGTFIRDECKTYDPKADWRLDVRDETGAVVLSFAFTMRETATEASAHPPAP